MKKFLASLIAGFYSITLMAQSVPEKVDIDINTKGGSNWYASPWVWIVGAAVFILLLVALLRGGGRRD